jgi:MraZ protein
MSQFLGTHQTRLDAKGRTSVPAAFRTALRRGSEAGTAALILRPSHKHSCIEAWPAEVFATLSTPLESMALFADDSDDLTTALYADAWPVEADKEGRIVLPDSLVHHAGLTDAVVFMGLGRLFQIWEPGAAARRTAEARERARSRGLTLPGKAAP